jgi:ComF family protein
MSFSPLDLLFPRRSLTGESGQWITPREYGELTSGPVAEEAESLRSRGIHALDRIVAASSYPDAPLLKRAIHTFKYRRIPALGDSFIELMVDGGVPQEQGAVLCPVPLHWTRRFQRGFNQAELLARALAERTGIPCTELLKRRRATGHQARRTRSERLHALDNAFVCTVDHPPTCVILIDDLATTGATLDACALALKTAGAQRVTGWVIAHG